MDELMTYLPFLLQGVDGLCNTFDLSIEKHSEPEPHLSQVAVACMPRLDEGAFDMTIEAAQRHAGRKLRKLA